MSFADLKRNRSSVMDKLTKTMESDGKSFEDKDAGTFWQPQVDKSGNGMFIVKFLPACTGEEAPFVKIYSHAWKNESTGKWYIENCRTTIGETDPVVEYSNKLWETGDKAKQTFVRNNTKRKVHYISNILIVSDPANPENEGKVFRFKYGTKIFDKLKAAMKPEFDDETPHNPFDLFGEKVFKLKIRKVEGQRNYDASVFEDSNKLPTEDEELEKIYNSLFSLQELIAPDKFKAYDVLEKRMNMVLGISAPQKQSLPAAGKIEEEDTPWDSTPAPAPRSQPAPSLAGGSEEDDLDYFARLAEDD